MDITLWTDEFLQKIEKLFPKRVWFVGLQGSHGRGEATENSDIDVVVILDKLTMPDIMAYNDMLDTLPHRELTCGFVSGRDEIMNWEPSELFQFYHDTTPIIGSLDELLPLIDSRAVERAIRTGVCGIFHACVHNMLHEKSEDILRGLYKAASFVVQAIVFRQTGQYFRLQRQLLHAAMPEEKTIVENFLKCKAGECADFDDASRKLFEWSKKHIDESRQMPHKPKA